MLDVRSLQPVPWVSSCLVKKVTLRAACHVTSLGEKKKVSDFLNHMTGGPVSDKVQASLLHLLKFECLLMDDIYIYIIERGG